MTEPIFEITKTARFDAAHHMSHTGADARHRQLHGHSFQVEATLRGPASETTGWVEDFTALAQRLRALADELDHGLLNDRPGLETPTLERLCLHFAGRLQPDFTGLSRIVVSRPTNGERCALNL